MNDKRTPAIQAQELICDMRVASLGTLTDNGAPFLSLVTIAQTGPLHAAMLLSGLAVHTKNLQQDGRCSLLITEPGGENGNALERARLTLTGRAAFLGRADDAPERSAFLALHPEAAMYADFGDFAIWRFEIEAAHLVAGFGRIVSLTREDLAD